jgi:hypothetical protein
LDHKIRLSGIGSCCWSSCPTFFAMNETPDYMKLVHYETSRTADAAERTATAAEKTYRVVRVMSLLVVVPLLIIAVAILPLLLRL